jgi:hypothetical protein
VAFVENTSALEQALIEGEERLPSPEVISRDSGWR